MEDYAATCRISLSNIDKMFHFKGRVLYMCQESNYLLVVDDQVGIRQLLLKTLSDEGYYVETAANGKDALRKVRNKAPSLILLDQKMPGLTGLETLSELRKISHKVPVVMMSACYELDVLMEEKKVDMAQYYFKKPFDLNELRNVISSILSQN